MARGQVLNLRNSGIHHDYLYFTCAGPPPTHLNFQNSKISTLGTTFKVNHKTRYHPHIYNYAKLILIF